MKMTTLKELNDIDIEELLFMLVAKRYFNKFSIYFSTTEF